MGVPSGLSSGTGVADIIYVIYVDICTEKLKSVHGGGGCEVDEDELARGAGSRFDWVSCDRECVFI